MKKILSLFTQYKETKGDEPFGDFSTLKYERLLSHFARSTSSIKMTSEEKNATWASISANTFLLTVDDLPVRKSILSRLYYRGLIPAINQQSVFLQKRKYALGVIVSTLIVSGSVSAFAQGSLPGDLFYPVKTNVTEKLRVSLAFSPQAKANVEATLATNRLEEAEGLALEGKLSTNLEQQIDEAFNTHVRKFGTHLTELEKRSEFKAIAKVGVFFQTRIAVHAAVLKDMKVNSKILSSNSIKTKILESNAGSNTIINLEDKILSATIPTIVVTRKAIAKISVSTSTDVDIYKDNRGRHKASLDINSEDAKDYLIKLHKDVGTPSPIMKTTPHTSVVSIFVP